MTAFLSIAVAAPSASKRMAASYSPAANKPEIFPPARSACPHFIAHPSGAEPGRANKLLIFG
jgi:hypothetical protein